MNVYEDVLHYVSIEMQDGLHKSTTQVQKQNEPSIMSRHFIVLMVLGFFPIRFKTYVIVYKLWVAVTSNHVQ